MKIVHCDWIDEADNHSSATHIQMHIDTSSEEGIWGTRDLKSCGGEILKELSMGFATFNRNTCKLQLYLIEITDILLFL